MFKLHVPWQFTEQMSLFVKNNTLDAVELDNGFSFRYKEQQEKAMEFLDKCKKYS